MAPSMSTRFILGSGSPRRRELLGTLGVVPDAVISPDIDETPFPGELPRAYCARVTAAKLAAVPSDPGDVVLAADTTVAVGRRILGKPANISEARTFLKLLSGRRHKVITSVAVRGPSGAGQKDNVTSVKLKRLSTAEIDGYLATGDWKGKAGGYAIQGPAAAFVPWIQGSYSGVMGLPLAETAALLQAAGWEIWQ